MNSTFILVALFGQVLFGQARPLPLQQDNLQDAKDTNNAYLDFNCTIDFELRLVDHHGNIISFDTTELPLGTNLIMEVIVDDPTAEYINLLYTFMVGGNLHETTRHPFTSVQFTPQHDQRIWILVEGFVYDCDGEPQFCLSKKWLKFNGTSNTVEVSSAKPSEQRTRKSCDPTPITEAPPAVKPVYRRSLHLFISIAWIFVIGGSLTTFCFLVFTIWMNRSLIGEYLGWIPETSRRRRNRVADSYEIAYNQNVQLPDEGNNNEATEEEMRELQDLQAFVRTFSVLQHERFKA